MDWLQNIEILLLMGIGGIVSWFVKSKYEELRTLEEKLNEERRRAYANIINPILNVLENLENNGSSKVLETYNLHDYRKNTSDLLLIGSDDVVLAHNRFIDYAYSKNGKNIDDDKAMNLITELFLEIRKSIMGKSIIRNIIEKRTKLKKEDMYTVLKL